MACTFWRGIADKEEPRLPANAISSRMRRMKLTARFATAGHRKQVIARAITCGLLMLLPSCAIPKFRQTDLGLGLPPSFNGAAGPDSSAQLRVDEFYNDPILTGLVCQAVATNRELKVLEEEINVARAEILYRRGAFLPLAGFRAGAGWDRNSLFTPVGAAEKELEYRPGKHFPATPGDSLLAFNFLIPIDIWRELRNARDAAIQRYFAAIERRNYFVTQMVADIASNYYALMALDQRLVVLDQIIEFQQRSYLTAQANLAAGRDTQLAVRRFEGEVRKNQSEKVIVRQEIIETENRINFLAGRFPQAIPRNSAGFYDLTINELRVGVPAQLLLNRPDIRQAERELAAAGLDVKVARAHFFPRIDITGNIGYQAFNPKYLFNPEAVIFNAAGELAVPVLNRAAIRSEYLRANALQLEAVYNYQRVIINGVVEVINQLSAVENYARALQIKSQQLSALRSAVTVAYNAYTFVREKGRVDYLDVLTVQRDLLEAQTAVINTKRQQLSAIVNVYQALGGGALVACPPPDQIPPPSPQMPPVPPPVPQLVPPGLKPGLLPQPEVEQAPLPREAKGAPEAALPPGLPPLPVPPEKDTP
jgi:NodT family efflux transporter outer membrane factor (OMF) lipoprotein